MSEQNSGGGGGWDEDSLLGIPPGATKEDLLAIKSLAEEVLKEEPERKDAKDVIAEVEKALKAMDAPEAPPEQPQPQPQLQQQQTQQRPPEKFPNDLREAYALLREFEGVVVKTPRQGEEKQKQINALKIHIHNSQQGLPVLATDSHSYGHAVGNNLEKIRRVRLELKARHDTDVKAMLAENDALRKENENLKAAAKK